MRPALFSYFEYRSYLRDFYEAIRQESPHFSYQYMAQKAEMDASNLAKIIQRKRHLPSKAIAHFREILSLNEEEFHYFETMVAMGKSRKEEQKQQLFNELIHLQSNQPRHMAINDYHFYNNWYTTAIYGLLDCYAFYGNYRELSEQLQPAISVKQAKESIALLKDLKLIAANEDGRYLPTESILSTGEEWRSYAVKNFQNQTIDLAKKALNTMESSERHIATLTFSASDEDMKEVYELSREYRKKVISLISKSDKGSRVYQMNMQLFPMSREGEDQ